MKRMGMYKNPYMSNAEKLSGLQRFILVHCYLYYEMDNPVISDASYTELCEQYEEVLAQSSESDKECSRFWHAFDDFDVSTGADLQSRLKADEAQYIGQIAWGVAGAYDKDVRFGKVVPFS